MVDRIGQRFGDYRLKRLISDRGAFADVYEGEHAVNQTKAAVKIWKVQIETRIFLNDVRAAVLRHSHIVEILDFNIKGDVPYLVMAYASNGSLQAQPLPLPLDHIMAYVRQIADALSYAHQRGIIHRDIKPDNILFGPNHEIWVGDFGIATSTFTRQDTMPKEPEKQLTGTPYYMAPEQWEDRASPASDQYALGVMVYEWLCGERPFQVNEFALYHYHKDVPPPPLYEKIPTIPSAVEKVVMRALEKDPNKRFRDVQTFAKALGLASWKKHSGISRVHAWLNEEPSSGTRRVYTPHTDHISTVAWSPDSRYVASGSKDSTIQVWDIYTGTHHFTYTGHTGPISAVAWSPDDRSIATGSEDGTVQIWDAQTRPGLVYSGKGGLTIDAGRRIGTLSGTLSGKAVAWSPDGRYIATGSIDSDKAVFICPRIAQRGCSG